MVLSVRKKASELSEVRQNWLCHDNEDKTKTFLFSFSIEV